MEQGCKKLIEADLPIKQISDNSRREKSTRQGHISTFHVWWARRPLAACRAVVLSSLLPDPVDENCPATFKSKAWELLSPLSIPENSNDLKLREALLQFISDFSSWKKATDSQMITIARGLVTAAYPDRKPLILDPFAGGGSIPLETLRVGAQAFAGDSNPVSVIQLKTLLEIIPKHGERLVNEIKKWAEWVKNTSYDELKEYYASDNTDEKVIGYLWARTINCEGPSCGKELPLIKRTLISKRQKTSIILSKGTDGELTFEVAKSEGRKLTGTMNGGSATCPLCGYTTPRKRIQAQVRQNGSKLLLLAVVSADQAGKKTFRKANGADNLAFSNSSIKWNNGSFDLNKFEPELTEPINSLRPSPDGRGMSTVTRYGFSHYGDLYLDRQKLSLFTLLKNIDKANLLMEKECIDPDFRKAITTLLALILDRQASFCNSFNRWASKGEHPTSPFSMNAFPVIWDFVEINPFSDFAGNWDGAIDWIVRVIDHCSKSKLKADGVASKSSATSIPMPDSSVTAVITDPPYYDAYQYADLSDFFYVWLKRSLRNDYPELFSEALTNKSFEIVFQPSRIVDGKPKDKAFYETEMAHAFAECKRIIDSNGLVVLVFAHKTTEGWEAFLNAIIKGGLMITASWPIETELPSRVGARGQARLMSSIHLVCRRRSANAGIGDWRDILSELQPCVHSWINRLFDEKILGADAIFACLGPALGIFSRYESVETAGGNTVRLEEYLEHVWSTVASEALKLIFEGADPVGFEPDARLTAMWLWTLRTGASEVPENQSLDNQESDEENKDEKASNKKIKGYLLSFDVARKIAQGLGIHLDELDNQSGIVKINGDVASLLFVKDRRSSLFPDKKEKITGKRPGVQVTLLQEPVSDTLISDIPIAGLTTLDKVHQAMLMFADGRSEALKEYLLKTVGNDDKFWRLADSLSALYPRKSEEKRWIDGVLSRKKSFGFV